MADGERSYPTLRRQRINIQRVQHIVLIWLDSNIDKNSEDCQDTMRKLQRAVNNVHMFMDSDQCIEFIQTIHENKVFVIMPGFLGQHIVPCVHNISQVDSIFILCGNETRHQRWTKDWPKVKGVFTELTPICDALKQVAHQCEQNAISLTFMTPNKKLDQLDPSFMYTMILKDILLCMDFEEQHLKEFLCYCRDIFVDNKDELSHIEELEHRYGSKSPIWWYTYECFLYPMLNRALRMMDGDIILRIAFFIRDLHQNIAELNAEQFEGRYCPASFKVFRGQGLSKTDFEQMSKSKGGLISFNNFLSTSKKREVSLSFAQQAAVNPDLVGILFIMEVNPIQSTIPFASIRDVSYFSMEEEVLFSMNSVFRIHDIQPINEKNRLFEVALTLTNDDDEDLSALTYSIRDEIPSCEGGWRPLAFILEKMGQFDKAEEVYQFILKETEYELGKGSLRHALGRIKFAQGNFQEAIMYYEKAINIYQAEFSPSSPNLFDMYNNIGKAYGAIGEHSTALDYFQKAIHIRQQSGLLDHPDLASSYNNIGTVYYTMGNYSEALASHEKALSIRQQSLPTNHPDLAVSFNDVGSVYESMAEYAKAHSCFERAVEIGQHSLPSNHPMLLKYKTDLERLKPKL
ncbi:unnamed protein product [Adineta ricciae]|uniref:ADP ribosyltransferase domain-containing protein n=2 Tax=Adineta ricciae TaxID=249248 RepID=A0A815FZ49_ADIRI|nr:unnamed protein product [Adineta ricciae]